MVLTNIDYFVNINLYIYFSKYDYVNASNSNEFVVEIEVIG